MKFNIIISTVVVLGLIVSSVSTASAERDHNNNRSRVLPSISQRDNNLRETYRDHRSHYYNDNYYKNDCKDHYNYRNRPDYIIRSKPGYRGTDETSGNYYR